MASPPSLAFDALLAPIPGDNPAGVPLRYLPPPNHDSPPVAVLLEEFRKEEDPNDYAPDDPMRPAKPKRANWAAAGSAGARRPGYRREWAPAARQRLTRAEMP